MRSQSIIVGDKSQISAARHAAQSLARDLDFDETRIGRAALVATEAVANMVRHGGGGTFVVSALAERARIGIEMLAIDSGPGMTDLEHSSRDGVSTTGTSGTGLGAMRRLSDEFEVDTAEGDGTIVRSVLWNRPADVRAGDRGFEVGAIVVPKRGETVSGDAWSMSVESDALTLIVADGLGHGPEASRAAMLATSVLDDHPYASVPRLVEIAHAKLRPTRGAAMAVVRREAGSQTVAFAGIGNIGAWLVEGGRRHHAMVSHNGIVGHNVQRIQEYRYECPAGGVLVLHSDGLESRWDLASRPAVTRCHASIIASVLYRRHARGRDDVVVLVAKLLNT
jgi:anti-sigma regulatory factor (Ser/Thr protein kinase)